MMTVVSRRTLAEIVYATLSQIPSTFGRLVYLSGYITEGGRYEHVGWTLRHGHKTVDSILRRAHQREWQLWLDLTVDQQHEQLQAFLNGHNRRKVLAMWTAVEPWHRLAPAQAKDHERRLFASDFRAVLELLRTA